VPKPAYAVVIPFFNEAENVIPLVAELDEALTRLAVKSDSKANCEVLLVDDGSLDDTGQLLDRSCATRPGWRVLHLLGNHGQAAALYIGMHATSAPRLILLDGDGQNDPADIPRVVALLDAGADLAVGVRAQRHDSLGRRLASRVANGVRSRILQDGARDAGCGLKAMRREVVAALIPIHTLYSFIPSLAAAAGFRVAEIVVSHRPRRGGAANYSVRRFLIWPLVDLLGILWFANRRFAPPELQQDNASTLYDPRELPNTSSVSLPPTIHSSGSS